MFYDDGRARIASEISRLTWPEHLDAFAADAGLTLEARDGDWHGTPATGQEPMTVSVYRKER